MFPHFGGDEEAHEDGGTHGAGLPSGARVLDLGCGAGYGTAELAGRARSATGIDLALEAVAHASSAYPQANISFVPASVP